MTHHEAMLYKSLDQQMVQCELCPHSCAIAPGKKGFCQVRENVQGKLVSLNYGLLVAMHADPIEKKPLFHFLPGSKSMSIASAGCNFKCNFCQNWQISQQPRKNNCVAGESVKPEQVVKAAIDNNCASISYTYTEPTIFYETAFDTATCAKTLGLKNCFVSNGYISEKAIEKITTPSLLDAINIDLKCFSDDTYRKTMAGSLNPVLESIRSLHDRGVWVEVTTLIVPGMNDSARELTDIASFIASVSTSIPWHVSRFHGAFEMSQNSATPISSLDLACCIGKQAGLAYVYGGNAPGQTDENTQCPSCKKTIISREGFCLQKNSLLNGKCPDCGESIQGVWHTEQ